MGALGGNMGRCDAKGDGDALDGEVQLELLEAAPRTVAKRGLLGGRVGCSVADSVNAERFVGGDSADVYVCLDLADGGNEGALRVRVEEAGQASVTHGGAGGRAARRGVVGADQACVVGVDGGRALQELDDAAG